MKRRELLKSSFAFLGLSAVNLSGCSKQKEEVSFLPKQTSQYSITAPLPFDFHLIDEMEELNKKLKKSKIKTLYNSLPFPLAFELEGYHSRRGVNKDIKNFDDFIKYVKYAQNKGFDFVYTLNSPKPFSRKDFRTTSKLLFNLLDRLKDSNCTKFKVSNTQMLNVLKEKYPQFELQASTSFEFHNVSQYINLVKNYPDIKTFDIAIDENRNFQFLKNLRKIFPDVELELMVNEPCLRGCPARIAHCATTFCEFNCAKIINNNPLEEFSKSGVIYPWNLEYYSALGINRFKFISSGSTRANIKNIEYLTYYLDCVENGIAKYNVKDFFEKIIKYPHDKNLKTIALKEIIKYLPDIKYFIKSGDKCAINCTTNCSYCIEKARELKKHIY